MMSCANEIKLCNLCFPDDAFFSESWSRYHSRVCCSVFLLCFEIPNSQMSLKFMYHDDWCCISYFTVELPSLCLVNQFFFYLHRSLWLGSLSARGLAISHDESRHHNCAFWWCNLLLRSASILFYFFQIGLLSWNKPPFILVMGKQVVLAAWQERWEFGFTWFWIGPEQSMLIHSI